MRPVIKWAPGQNGVRTIYNPYSKAKSKLLENFGNKPFYYCNYCDRVIPGVNLEVEHIQPKSQNGALEFRWDNFLIACKNCNLTKDEDNTPLGNMLLPQFQNTWDCFLIRNDGTLEADPANVLAHARALQTVNVLGLDRGFSHARRQRQDDRYDVRHHISKLAKRALIHYENGVPNYLNDVVNQAIVNGFWYVWMKTFQNHSIVQDGLIAAFQNTYQNCLITNVDKV